MNELFGASEFKNGFEALRQFDSNHDGVIDSKDIFYVLSIIFAGLLGTELVMSRRNASN